MSVNEKLKKAAQESKRYFHKIENETRAHSWYNRPIIDKLDLETNQKIDGY